jgi:hypothetical protein
MGFKNNCNVTKLVSTEFRILLFKHDGASLVFKVRK